MNRVFVHGSGAVSPAGWGVSALLRTLEETDPIPVQHLERPGRKQPLRVRRVPVADPRPASFGHARLRRASPISQYAVAAAQEALGPDAAFAGRAERRLGVILCVMSGCVNYSRRFFDEALRDPATASPLVFPETVFNAPSSHLAAVLGTTAINYTLVGDPATYLDGLVLAAQWLSQGLVDGCVVVGAEELDWLTADAFRLFARRLVVSEGAGALYLTSHPQPFSVSDGQPPGATNAKAVTLDSVTDTFIFWNEPERAAAARAVATQLLARGQTHLVCDGLQQVPRFDRAEALAWKDWKGTRRSVKTVLGEGLMAAAAWQCVAAVELLRAGQHTAAFVPVAGCNAQVAGARFATVPEPNSP
jgi:3-oxoacyl-(acyl-carrier-protein) synthase